MQRPHVSSRYGDKTCACALLLLAFHIHGPGSIQEILAAGDTELVGIAESDPARRAEVSPTVQRADLRRPCGDAGRAAAGPRHGLQCAPRKAEAILSCLERNVHVLVDKPMVIELEDLARVELALETSTSELQMMVTERFAPPFVRLKELVEFGLPWRNLPAASPPGRMSLPWPNASPGWWRESKEGGPILDLMIHDIDLARWYSGASVQSVTAHHTQRRWLQYPGFNDVAHAMFAMDSGIVASMEADWLTPCTTPWDCRFFLTGTEGAAEVAQPALQRTCSTGGTRNRACTCSLDEIARIPADKTFVRRIRGEAPIIATAQDAIDSTRAVLIAREAARKGQTLSL